MSDKPALSPTLDEQIAMLEARANPFGVYVPAILRSLKRLKKMDAKANSSASRKKHRYEKTFGDSDA